jgi:hypothetical protein
LCISRRVPWPPGINTICGSGASLNKWCGFTESPFRVSAGSFRSATVKTLNGGGAPISTATEKTSNGPQKSSTSTSSNNRMATLRVGFIGDPQIQEVGWSIGKSMPWASGRSVPQLTVHV